MGYPPGQTTTMKFLVKSVNPAKNVVVLCTAVKAGRVMVETNYWVRCVDVADWTAGSEVELTTEEEAGLNEIE